MNQSSTEVSRVMYLTYSSLLYHFIECSTRYSQVSYLLQLNLLPNIKSEKLPSAFSSPKKPLFIGVFGWRHSWMQKCITLPPFAIITFNRGSIVTKRSLCFTQIEPLFHQDRGSVLSSPRADNFQPTGKQPSARVPPTFARVLNLYTPRGEHIVPVRWVYIPTTVNI